MCIVIRVEGVPPEMDNTQSVYHVVYPSLPLSTAVQTNELTDAVVLPTAPPFEDIDDTGRSLNNDENVNGNFFKMWSNNWREFTPLIPGLLLILASGSQFISIIHLINASNDFRSFRLYLSACNMADIFVWFSGVIIGSAFAAFIVSRQRKLIIYCVCSIMLIGGGACYTYKLSHLIMAIARCLLGVSFGIAHLTVIVHAADITAREMRSFAVKFIAFITTVSLIVFELINALWVHANDMRTGYLLVFIGAGTLVSLLLTKESIPFLLSRAQDGKALKQLTEYRSEHDRRSIKSRLIFDQLKLQFIEDLLKKPKNAFSLNNLRPLIITTSIRLLKVFATNIPILVLTLASIGRVRYLNAIPVTLVYTAFLAIRLLHGWLAFYFSRLITKQYYCYYTLAIINGVTLLLMLTPLHMNTLYFYEFAFVYLLTQMLMAFGLDAFTNEQIEKRFAPSVRPWSIAIGETLEYFVHFLLIALIYLRFESIVVFINATGLILFGILLRYHKVNAERNVPREQPIAPDTNLATK